MDFKDRLIQVILEWEDLESQGLADLLLRVNLPSAYKSIEEYIQTWDAVILADFRISLCEAYLRPPGHPAGFVAFTGKVHHTEPEHLADVVSYKAEGIGFECILLLRRTGFCYFDGKRLYMSTRCSFVFEARNRLSEPHFTGLNFMIPLARIDAILYIGSLHATPWMQWILDARCAGKAPTSPSSHCHDDAISAFLNGQSGIYLWQGPPGTGKTKVLALLSKLFLAIHSDLKVLVCAHSNDAVHNLATRLQDASVPCDIINWSVSAERLAAHTPSAIEKKMINRHDVSKVRIWITTCTRARLIRNVTFQLVILDEAASCPIMDGDMIVPFLDVECGFSKLLLVGDCEQLPPVMKMFRQQQPYASFMGRCCAMSRECVYPFDVSYRLGPMMLKFLKDNIYHNIPSFRCFTTEIPTLRNILRSGEPFPEVACINVVGGSETRVIKNAMKGWSWINHLEAQTVATLVCGLLRNGVHKANIVVISPYAEQTSCVKALLQKEREAKHVKNTTVHGMQGSERPFVIVTTVRTSLTGFIDASTLMNVALSRQKVFLIIVGNAKFLHDHTIWWSRLIKYLIQEKVVFSPEWMDFKL